MLDGEENKTVGVCLEKRFGGKESFGFGSLVFRWWIERGDRGKQYCFTEAIIQSARTETGKLIFGDADDNVGYVFFVKEDLEKAGHYVELSFTTRKATMQNSDRIDRNCDVLPIDLLLS